MTAHYHYSWIRSYVETSSLGARSPLMLEGSTPSFFLGENHGLRLGISYSLPSCFTLSCEMFHTLYLYKDGCALIYCP